MSNRQDLEKRVETLEKELAAVKRGAYRGVRKRSASRLGDLPFYEVAIGPDPDRGELRGHAKAVIAIGDIATGLLAVGGWARGILAIGGLATGLVSLWWPLDRGSGRCRRVGDRQCSAWRGSARRSGSWRRCRRLLCVWRGCRREARRQRDGTRP